MIDIVHLDDSKHEVDKPKQKQLKKKNSPGRQMEDIRVVKKAINGNGNTNLKTLVLTIDTVETSP